MKKLDKLVLKSFLGRFLVVAGVMLFIFLSQYMIKNFKHFIGKDLGFDVLGQLFGYFGLLMVPVTLPISMLLASLMSFGTLGEHSELTAIKSSGVSLLRVLRPVALFALLMTGALLVYNEFVVPKANLLAYSLLYDVKQKKPTLNLQEGVFYNGIEGYSIKVEKKLPDGKSLEKVMIYDHTKGKGNTDVITAEQGYMEMVRNDQYLSLILIDGASVSEVEGKKRKNNPRPKKNQTREERAQAAIDNMPKQEFVRNEFDTAKILFSLESFGMGETDKKLFLGHNIMKRQPVIWNEMDSLKMARGRQDSLYLVNISAQLTHHGLNPATELRKPRELSGKGLDARNNKTEEKDLLAVKGMKSIKPTPQLNPEKLERDALLKEYRMRLNAYNRANNAYNLSRTQSIRDMSTEKTIAQSLIDIFRRYTQPIAIFVMFLIGAPLGAIIKKGGLGLPVIVCVIFFVIYYISTLTGEKYARELIVLPAAGVWASNALLFIIGLFFLIQAKNDVRLFELDYYQVLLNRLFGKKK